MRKQLSFECDGTCCAATLDDAPGSTGLLIISGGNEIRIGAHRGMAKLAADIAEAGFPVFRFDRRGIGDSEGENEGFTSSSEDIEAALAAFRVNCPSVNRIVAFGNCDGATAILLHQPAALSGAILGNIWVIEEIDDLPPQAAIKAHYLERMMDPKAWLGLLTGAVDLKKLIGGLFKLSKATTPQSLALDVAARLEALAMPATILLSNHDATALAFLDAWRGEAFAKARANPFISVEELNSDSHSFASDADYAALRAALLALLRPV